MSIPEDTQLIYEHLAQQCQQRQETLQRDQFLLLAADSAHTLGRAGQAHRLHRQLLQLSPSTMLRPFASFGEALDSSDVRAYVCDLRQQYPPETAAQMLEAGSECSLSTDLFADTDSDMVIPLCESNPFGNGDVAPTAQVSPRRNSQPWIDMPAPGKASPPPSADEKQRHRSAPSLHLSAPPTPAAVDVPIPPAVSTSVPTLPGRPRRRSPYEDPDYGPKVPAAAKTEEDDEGIWFIHVLAGLLGLGGIAALAYVFVRPFLVR